jgi:hypothetical protein
MLLRVGRGLEPRSCSFFCPVVGDWGKLHPGWSCHQQAVLASEAKIWSRYVRRHRYTPDISPRCRRRHASGALDKLHNRNFCKSSRSGSLYCYPLQDSSHTLPKNLTLRKKTSAKSQRTSMYTVFLISRPQNRKLFFKLYANPSGEGRSMRMTTWYN